MVQLVKHFPTKRIMACLSYVIKHRVVVATWVNLVCCFLRTKNSVFLSFRWQLEESCFNQECPLYSLSYCLDLSLLNSGLSLIAGFGEGFVFLIAHIKYLVQKLQLEWVHFQIGEKPQVHIASSSSLPLWHIALLTSVLELVVLCVDLFAT